MQVQEIAYEEKLTPPIPKQKKEGEKTKLCVNKAKLKHMHAFSITPRDATKLPNNNDYKIPLALTLKMEATWMQPEKGQKDQNTSKKHNKHNR